MVRLMRSSASEPGLSMEQSVTPFNGGQKGLKGEKHISLSVTQISLRNAIAIFKKIARQNIGFSNISDQAR